MTASTRKRTQIFCWCFKTCYSAGRGRQGCAAFSSYTSTSNKKDDVSLQGIIGRILETTHTDHFPDEENETQKSKLNWATVSTRHLQHLVQCSFRGDSTVLSAFWKCVRALSIVTMITWLYWHFNAWRPKTEDVCHAGTFTPNEVLSFTPHNFQMSYHM